MLGRFHPNWRMLPVSLHYHTGPINPLLGPHHLIWPGSTITLHTPEQPSSHPDEQYRAGMPQGKALLTHRSRRSTGSRCVRSSEIFGVSWRFEKQHEKVSIAMHIPQIFCTSALRLCTLQRRLSYMRYLSRSSEFLPSLQ